MPNEPVILFFVLGLMAGIIRSDLKIPGVLYESISIFLLLAIGLKGGIELSKVPLASIAGPTLPVAKQNARLWQGCCSEAFKLLAEHRPLNSLFARPACRN